MVNALGPTASRSYAAASSPAASGSSLFVAIVFFVFFVFVQRSRRGLDQYVFTVADVQLKNQSPLDPLDPNQFVVQLAQSTRSVN